jgi:hypothetical protein
MFGRLLRTAHEDRVAEHDEVILPDGRVMLVPRANLAAAKALHAEHKAAECRVAARAHAQSAYGVDAPDREARRARRAR